MLKNQKFFSTNVGKLINNNFKNSNINFIRSADNLSNSILANKLRDNSKFLKNLTGDNINFYYTGPNSGIINKYYGRNRRFRKKVDGHVGTIFDIDSLRKNDTIQKNIPTKSKSVRSEAKQYFPVGDHQFYGVNKTVFTDGRSVVSPQGFTLFSPKDMGFIQNNFSDTLENIKERFISQIPTKEVFITETSRRILESLGDNKKNKEETREEVRYKDRPIRKNNIILRKPEIKYKKERIYETPEMIHKSILEYPEE